MVSTAPQQFGVDRRRLYRLATTLPAARVRKKNGEPYSEYAIKSWRSPKGKLPPDEVKHRLCHEAGLSVGWLYGEGDESLLPDGPLFPPPTGGASEDA